MTSYYEIEQYLAKLITAVAHSERNVEAARIDLANNEFFFPFNYFRHLDQKGKGYLTQDDLVNFFKSYKLTPTYQEIEHLFKVHPSGGDRISYNDFLLQALPQSDSILKNQCLDRANRGHVELNESEQISIDDAVLNVYEREIEFYRQVNKARIPFAAMSDFNPQEAFQLIDTAGKGTLDFKSLQTFLNQLHLSFNQDDYFAFVRRIDKSRSGKVNFFDFRNGLFPTQSAGSPLKTGYQHFTKDTTTGYQTYASSKPNIYDRRSQDYAPQENDESNIPSNLGHFYHRYMNHGETHAEYEPRGPVQQRSKHPEYRPATNLLDQYLQPEAQQDSYTEGSSPVFIASENKNSPIATPVERHQQMGGSFGPKKALDRLRPERLQQASKETLNLPLNPSEGEFQTSGQENSITGKDFAQKQLNRARSSEGFSSATYERHNQSPMSPLAATVNPRNFYNKTEAIQPMSVRGGSPLHHRNADPLYNTYWSYNQQHNKSITTLKPFTATNFPYELSKTVKRPVAYDLKSNFIPHYYPNIDSEKVDVKRYRENPFQYTDHEHYFGNYYNKLRGAYFEKYFDAPHIHDGVAYEYSSREGFYQQPNKKQAQYFEHHEPRKIPYKNLQIDPHYRSQPSFHSRTDGFAIVSPNGPGLMKRSGVQETQREFQKPSRFKNVPENQPEGGYDRRIDYHQKGQKAQVQEKKNQQQGQFNELREVHSQRSDPPKEYQFQNKEFELVWSRSRDNFGGDEQ